jgi:hypothetical protein
MSSFALVKTESEQDGSDDDLFFGAEGLVSPATLRTYTKVTCRTCNSENVRVTNLMSTMVGTIDGAVGKAEINCGCLSIFKRKHDHNINCHIAYYVCNVCGNKSAKQLLKKCWCGWVQDHDPVYGRH